jgi:hypothetical protein
MQYATTRPPDLAAAMMAAQQQRPDYRPVRRGGAGKAADQLASLLAR